MFIKQLAQRVGLKLLALAGVSTAALFGGPAMETLYTAEARNAAGDLLWIEQVHNRVTTVGLNKLLDATFKSGLTTPAWYIGLVGPSSLDGAISASSPNLACATSVPFASGDVGRPIIVRGAGAGGSDLTTTIQSFTDTGHVVLATAATTSVISAAVLFDGRSADTMASHTSWTELAAYSEGVRQTFTPGTVAGGSLDNSAAKATFTINAANTLIGGLFLTDSSTKSGTAGTIYGMAPFAANGFRQLNSGDTVTVTVTLSATAA